MTRPAGRTSRRKRREDARPPPLVVPTTPSTSQASLPQYCYQRLQPSHPVPVAWPAEGPPAAAATRRGSRRPMNEDRVFADARAGIYGVCDGHGGPDAAEFVADALHAMFSLNTPHERIRSDFHSLNKRLHSMFCGREYLGTTVTAAALIPGFMVRLVHLGDCRAVLIDAAGVAHSLTIDHSPNRSDETTRITNAGGAVLNGRVNGVLAVSRALGDYELKDVLSVVPDVIDRPLGPSDHLLVIGSDGFFDCVSEVDLADALSDMPVLPGTAAVPLDLKDAVLTLINLAVARRATDDISLVLIDVRLPSKAAIPRHR